MKRKLSVLLSLILVFAMAFTLFGCGDDSKDDGDDKSGTGIVGKWEGEVDLAETMNLMLSAMNITLDDFAIKMVYEFKADGTLTTSADAESVNEAFVGMFEDMAAQSGMTLDQLLAASGVSSVDELIESSMGGADFAESLTTECKYKLEGDKLYISSDLDSDIPDDEYVTVELSATTLKLVSYTGSDDAAEITEAMYPMTFNKVK